MSGEEIRLTANYNGVRVRCEARLENARISIQIDVGFGDVVTPGAQAIVYPTLLDFDTPHLLGCTPETAIAEKLEAMVVLDMANSRMKDFLDIWILAQGRSFDGKLLAEAIAATFHRRGTALPTSNPVALTLAFYSATSKQAQWAGYVRKARVLGNVPTLDEVAAQIAASVMPVIEAIAVGSAFSLQWPPGGPWTDATGPSHQERGTSAVNE